MNEKTASAAVRVCTNEFDLEFIIEAIGIVPTRQFRKGERLSPRNPASAVFDKSMCVYESTVPDTYELHDHIKNILGLLESKLANLHSIRSRIASMDLFCMFSSENGQGSAELDANLLRRIADLELDLIIDLYPPLPGKCG